MTTPTHPDHFHAPAYWSPKAIIPGIYAIAPMLPGTIAFGMAFGALCAQKNFTLPEVQVMMAFVYGGLSQFVAVQSWPDTLTVSSVATLALLTTTVNIRFALMSASLRPWFGTLPAWQSYPSMLLVTDGGWLAAERYRAHGGANAWFFVGGGIVLYVVWWFASIPGFLLAGQLADVAGPPFTHAPIGETPTRDRRAPPAPSPTAVGRVAASAPGRPGDPGRRVAAADPAARASRRDDRVR